MSDWQWMRELGLDPDQVVGLPVVEAGTGEPVGVVTTFDPESAQMRVKFTGGPASARVFEELMGRGGAFSLSSSTDITGRRSISYMPPLDRSDEPMNSASESPETDGRRNGRE